MHIKINNEKDFRKGDGASLFMQDYASISSFGGKLHLRITRGNERPGNMYSMSFVSMIATPLIMNSVIIHQIKLNRSETSILYTPNFVALKANTHRLLVQVLLDNPFRYLNGYLRYKRAES